MLFKQLDTSKALILALNKLWEIDYRTNMKFFSMIIMYHFY